MERELHTAQCDDREKVLYGPRLLRGAAQSWWESYLATHANPDTITWEEFRGSFRQYHVPAGLMTVKKEEFLALKQGPLSVSEYRDRFLQLSRYAPEDVNTDAKIAEITVGKEPNTMVVDKNNMVWVLCEGATWDYIDPGQPELWKIDPATKQATRMVLFTENAMNLAIDPSGSYLYYVRGGDYITGGDVHRVSIDNSTVEDDFVILANDRMIYKLFVNPNNGDIYLSDAKDYTVDGTVYRYSSTGTLLKSFDAGICPAFMLFY